MRTRPTATQTWSISRHFWRFWKTRTTWREGPLSLCSHRESSGTSMVHLWHLTISYFSSCKIKSRRPKASSSNNQPNSCKGICTKNRAPYSIRTVSAQFTYIRPWSLSLAPIIIFQRKETSDPMAIKLKKNFSAGCYFCSALLYLQLAAAFAACHNFGHGLQHLPCSLIHA